MNELEESERLIFRSAVTISETDMAIERSRRLIAIRAAKRLMLMRLLLKYALSVI
jgi:hypothetical protein